MGDPTRGSQLLKHWLLRYLALVSETGADSTCFQAPRSAKARGVVGPLIYCW